jgi:hypothetical protein
MKIRTAQDYADHWLDLVKQVSGVLDPIARFNVRIARGTR